MRKIIYTPDVLQYSDYDCGDMCVQGVLAYYGQDINEVKLLKKLKTKKSSGTETEHIIEFFKNRGFKVDAGNMTIDTLRTYIRKKIPVIILAQAWKTEDVSYERTEAYGHYMIVIGYDEKNIYFEDPAVFGKGFIPVKEFKKRWHAIDIGKLQNFGIAIWGKKPFNFKKFVKIM